MVLAMMTIGVKATSDQNINLAASWSAFSDGEVGINGMADVINSMIGAPLMSVNIPNMRDIRGTVVHLIGLGSWWVCAAVPFSGCRVR